MSQKDMPEHKPEAKEVLIPSEEIDVSLGTTSRYTKPKEEAQLTYKPRARLADSREASMRDKEERIKQYTQNFDNVQLGTLHIPKENWPEGYAIMWARESVKGFNDARNIARLEQKGWEPVYIDEFPEYFASMDFTADDSQLARVNGMLLMKRLIEIHNHELKQMEGERKKQSNYAKGSKSIDADLHPFSVKNTSWDNNNQFFPSDGTSNAFAGTFN